MGSGDRAVVREWDQLCRTAKMHPSVMWSSRRLYQRYIRWTGELRPGGEEAIERLRERRVRAHVCAEITLHPNPRKASPLGDVHEGCCPGTCKRTAQLALGV